VSAKWLKKPLVVKLGRGGRDYFDLDVVHRKRLFGKFFARLIAKQPTAWVANSREIVEDLRRWSIPAARIVAIPNGVAVPDSVLKPLAEHPLRFLCMGRLDPEKAVDQIIEAFAALPAAWPVELVILGDGQCRTSLEALVAKLGQTSRIRFEGAVADVTPYVADADVYVSSSLSEGMSNALLEAMSFGVVPIASRVSGVEDLISDGRSGLLFEPGDRRALLDRLRDAAAMSSDRRREMGEAARATILARFEMGAVARQHIELYNRLVEAGTA
jgi:glycosyltransferase involved in cell wall biosynthesis